MGTDVYLSWDERTEEEKEAQYTGFSIDAGNVGYLRASIGMYKENRILRQVFPPEVWEAPEALAHEFSDTGFEEIQIIGAKYLLSVMFDTPIEENDGATKQLKDGEEVMRMLSGKGFEHVVGGARKSSLRGAVMWLNAVFEFYLLGLQKAEAGLNPKVYISW